MYYEYYEIKFNSFTKSRSSENQHPNAQGDDEELPQLFDFLPAHINEWLYDSVRQKHA